MRVGEVVGSTRPCTVSSARIIQLLEYGVPSYKVSMAYLTNESAKIDLVVLDRTEEAMLNRSDKAQVLWPKATENM